MKESLGGTRPPASAWPPRPGNCTQLREFLEARGQAYVLWVPSNFYLTVARGVRLTCKDAATRLLAADRWEIRPAGTGSKGQRYAWPG